MQLRVITLGKYLSPILWRRTLDSSTQIAHEASHASFIFVFWNVSKYFLSKWREIGLRIPPKEVCLVDLIGKERAYSSCRQPVRHFYFNFWSISCLMLYWKWTRPSRMKWKDSSVKPKSVSYFLLARRFFFISEEENTLGEISSVQLLSHAWLFATPWDCSTPGFPVHYQLLELAQTHGHRVGDATQSYPVIPFSSSLHSFPASGSSLMSQFFESSGQSIGDSASASVLPKNIQDWSPLGWTGWISLEIKLG